MKTTHKTKGFTLLEILLVIAAIGILVAIVLIAINPNKQIEAARNAQRRSDLNNISKAIQQFIIDNGGSYPGALQSMTTGSTVGLCVVAGCTNGLDLTSTLSPTYIASIPLPDKGQYLITKTANGVSTSYDSSTIWATAGASAAPTLDLNFARDKQLTNAVTGTNPITFTRGSIGTYTGSDGLLKTAVANEPRFDHNPVTRESLGLLVEEQRTNSIRNNTMAGAVPGTPGTLPTNWAVGGLGTLTQQVVGIGTLNGISYIDLRFSGTSSGTQMFIRLDGSTAIAAANGQTWTFSLWSSLVGGSLANISQVSSNSNNYNSGASYIGGILFTDLNTTATLTRRSAPGTITDPTAAFIQPQIYINMTSGAAIDITLRIGLPQLEQGAFATSVIPTSGSTIQRFADNASITGGNFTTTPGGWYNASASTFYSEAASSSGAAVSGYGWVFGNDFNNSIQFYRQSDFQPVAQIRTANVNEYGAIGNGQIWTGTSFNKFALAVSSTSGRQASNGLLSATVDDTSIALPTVTTMSIGSFNGATALNGTIKRITYWPTRLSNTVLQSITQ